MFKLWESSLADLHQSAVDAFPLTTKRQHVVGPIQIDEVRATPFLGMNTLLFRCRAINEDRIYNPVILLLNVNFNGDGASIEASDNHQIYSFEPLSEHDTDSRVRCQCGDYYWRAQYANWLDRSLYGSNRKPYENMGLRGPANPNDSPMLCKHLMKLVEKLRQDGIIV
jgi:hypothetical protein